MTSLPLIRETAAADTRGLTPAGLDADAVRERVSDYQVRLGVPTERLK